MNCPAGGAGAGCGPPVASMLGGHIWQGPAPLTSACTVSIIDDDPAVLSATQRLLRLRGFDVSAFASAEEFLASPAAGTTACVVSDVRMSGMSGIDLQAYLAASGRDLPFIFLTAFPDDVSRRRALDAGAVAFLAKPFDGQTLVESIREAFARK